MLYLMNSKDKNTKKDLRLAYSQENMTAYPPRIKRMARYLSANYPNNKPAHQRDGKKEDKKKGDDPKSEDMDSNTGATAGAQVEDTTTPEEFTAPSRGASIGANVLKINEQSSSPSRTIEEIKGAYLMNNDDFGGETNPGVVSIDTNSEKMKAISHIQKQHTHKYQVLVPPEVSNVIANEPQTYNLSHNYQLDSLKKFKDSNTVLKTNNVTCTTDTDLLCQENQD